MKTAVNKMYKEVEIDIDGIFKVYNARVFVFNTSDGCAVVDVAFEKEKVRSAGPERRWEHHG